MLKNIRKVLDNKTFCHLYRTKVSCNVSSEHLWVEPSVQRPDEQSIVSLFEKHEIILVFFSFFLFRNVLTRSTFLSITLYYSWTKADMKRGMFSTTVEPVTHILSMPFFNAKKTALSDTFPILFWVMNFPFRCLTRFKRDPDLITIIIWVVLQ